MSNIELSAELNNLGAAYLQAGYLRKSLELFRDALRYTLCDLHAPRSSSAVAPSAVPFKDGNPSAVAFEQETVLGHIKLTEPTPGSSQEDDVETSDAPQPSPAAVPFVYSHAINVIPSPQAYSSDPLISTTVASSIILFNIGIVYHLKGLEGSGESSLRLTKARSFYQKCLILLADAGVPNSSCGSPVIDMLCMAIYNNLAQASYEMLIYDESRLFFEGLIKFALTVAPSRYGDVSVASMVDQQKSNFLLNAIILHAPKFAAAA